MKVIGMVLLHIHYLVRIFYTEKVFFSLPIHIIWLGLFFTFLCPWCRNYHQRSFGLPSQQGSRRAEERGQGSDMDQYCSLNMKTQDWVVKKMPSRSVFLWGASYKDIFLGFTHSNLAVRAEKLLWKVRSIRRDKPFYQSKILLHLPCKLKLSFSNISVYSHSNSLLTITARSFRTSVGFFFRSLTLPLNICVLDYSSQNY